MLEGPPTPYRPTPHLINQFSNLHVGRVMSLADPKGRGRAQILCPGLLDSGQKNWTCWVHNTGNPIGSAIGNGDEGDWWPLQVGQCVLVGFVCGEPEALWVIPGPPPADGAEQLMPAEPKSYNDGRKITRCRIRKSEAGHSLIMDDNGKEELLGLISWGGGGFIAYEPGKEEDEKESPDEESKPRKGERRGTRNVWAGTAGKPSEMFEGGKGYYGLNDPQGNGILTLADDKEGGMMVFPAYKSDGTVGCSIMMDAENETVIITGGKTQVQVRGKDLQKVYFTTAMIWEAPYMAITGAIKAIRDKLKGKMTKYDE